MQLYNERELLIINAYSQGCDLVDDVKRIFECSSKQLSDNVDSYVEYLISDSRARYNLYSYVHGGYSEHYVRRDKKVMHQLLRDLCKRNDFEFGDDIDDRLLNFAFAYCSLFDFSSCEYGISTYIRIDISDGGGWNRDNFSRVCLNLSRSEKLKVINVVSLLLGFHSGGNVNFHFIINKAWEEIAGDRRMIDWLNKNEVLWGWAYNYIIKQFINEQLLSWMKCSDIDRKKSLSKKKEVVINFFDVLSPADKVIVLLRMRNAGTQQKHRIKSGLDDSDRKKIQIPMRAEVKSKLEKLSVRDDKCLYEVIEGLIEDAYEKRFGPR
ncbi:hypothetical protein ACJW88_00590 [Plesiomonas shigelloides]|uniref:hypothetical protein n=1 Tax=Plesiomonas shigelloides TaxID=703 RepID=UPI002247F317|nr:hypothetical protein [Plesiomonas shigelloides]MCX2497502.1 hypothetical protein [Plesiomonas shigelloides]